MQNPRYVYDTRISIHAPAWGATRVCAYEFIYRYYFNPRSRVGSDGTEKTVNGLLTVISIHAPAWGATRIHRFCVTSH